MARATGRSARSAPGRGLLLGRRVLLGDDLVLDFLVGRARQDLLGDQLVLPLVGTVVDDLLRQRVADAGQLLEVLVAGAVEVELLLHRLAGTALGLGTDRKSTRLNSSHDQISYAVFCLKKKTKTTTYL